MPKRIQRKQTKECKLPEGVVYVDRSTKWGNPFHGPRDGIDIIEHHCVVKKYMWALEFPSEERLAAWLWAGGKSAMWLALVFRKKELLDTIRGRDLACWCPLDKPCHADVLLKLANTY